MKKRRSIISTILCIAIAVSIFAFFPADAPDVAAYTSLPGVEEIKHSSDNFNILEIVPEAGSGSIGWYISGQEPGANWAQDKLASLSGSARSTAAVNYLSALESAGLLSTSNSPLYKTGDYKEYTPWEDRSKVSGLKTLTLNTEETYYPVSGTFVEATTGGEYRANNTYTVSDGGSGGYYDQDIFGLSSIGTPYADVHYYYTLGTFSPLSAFAEVDDGQFIFRVVSFIDKDGNGTMDDPFDLIINKNDNTYIDPSQAASLPQDQLIYLDFQGCMGSTYLTGLNLLAKYYIAPFTVSTLFNGNTPQFEVESSGFVRVKDGKGHFNASTLSYTYVGSGAAGANYSYSSTGTNTYTVKTSTLFYTGDFTNNNWFLKYVFDWDSSEIAYKIKVRSIVASKITVEDVNSADMIVLSRGFGTSVSYSSGNDINTNVYDALLTAKESKLPIIVDNTLRSRTDVKIGQLAASLTSGKSESHFVSNNVYCISSPLATGTFNDTISGNHQTSGSAFYAVWYEITYENFLRLQNSSNARTLPEKVSMATCIRYIINYGGQRIITNKTDIRVLEIQPGNGSSLTKSQVNGWTGIPTSKITIDTMSTSEFIGKIDDLVETYDLIYIGANLTGFNTTGTGSQITTDYTDNDMDGLIYTNIGDTYAKSGSKLTQLTGLLDRDYSTSKSNGKNPIDDSTTSWTFRLSGNDITSGKVSQLKDFADAGYPVVVADKLMSGTSGHDGFSFTAVVTESNGTLLATAREAEGTLIPYGVTKNYQWYKKSASGDTLVSSSGASYTPTESGTYYCRITISSQTATSNTAIAALTNRGYTAEAANPSKAQAGSFPESIATYTITITRKFSEGNDVYTITVSSTVNDTISYQWYSWRDGQWQTIKGANSASYKTNNNNNNYYYCLVTINGNSYSSQWANHDRYENNNQNAQYTITQYTTFNAGVSVSPGVNGATLEAYWDPPVGDLQNRSITWYRINTNGSTSEVSRSGSITYTSGTYFWRARVKYNNRDYEASSNNYTIAGGGTAIALTVNTDYGSTANVPAVYPSLVVNTNTVDYCSQLYSFLSEIRSLPNAFTESGASTNSSTLTQYLNLSKPKIVFSTNESGTPMHPPEYTGPYQGASLSGKTLSYTFTIENATDVTPVETRYYCNLYLDMNADGRYDYSEQLADIIIKDQSGNIIRTGELRAGVTYTVTRTMPDEYVGIIPWKLEVVKTTQSRVHASQHNYTHIKGNPTTIYVLQLLHNGTISEGLNLATNQTYQSLLAQVSSDFIVNITTKKVSELSSVSAGTVVRKNEDGQDEAISYNSLDEYLNTFDMLILGFADAYRELNKTSADAVVNFINNPSGKSVLFTHDTTSIVNLPENNYPTTTQGKSISQPASYFWGYYFNTLLRDAVGLDRYGVTNPDYGVTKYSPNKVTSSTGINVAAGPVSLAYVDRLTSAGYSIAYTPKKGSTTKTTVSEVQGFTNYTLKRYGERNDDFFSTTEVSQVNEGQITTYPFDLNLYGFGGNTNSSKKTMSIALTHEQYYQLNMNSEDIVVWYCLSGSNYNSLPNDVMNAYYIYSVGNVTYSGAGHSYGTVVEAEAKLFINTMIASYQTATTPPTLKIIDPTDPTGERELTDKFYVADESGALASSDQNQADTAIYFSVHDPSLGAGKKITAKFSYTIDATTVETALNIFVKNGSLYPINRGGQNYSLSGGATYYVYPNEELLVAINNKDRVSLTIEIVSNLLPSMPASASITLHKLGLFPLE